MCHIAGYSACPLCLGTRSGLVQVVSGIGYPLILAPLLCMVSARSNYTYSVPSIKHRALFLNMLKTTFPFKTSILAVMLANLLGTLLIYFKSVENSFSSSAGSKFRPNRRS
jgi:transmembrane protein 126A